ncbi:MAG: hypothetical protein ACXWL5_01135 [Candidatus Chromulinivorax sp.]
MKKQLQLLMLLCTVMSIYKLQADEQSSIIKKFKIKKFNEEAPQNFIPIKKFKKAKYINTYFPNTHTAEIKDQKQNIIYQFENIVEYSQPVTPPNIKNPQLEVIGEIPNPKYTQEKSFYKQNKKVGGQMPTITLYGILKSGNITQTNDVEQNDLADQQSQAFTPADQFNKKGFIGNYFINNKTAFIINSSKKDKVVYKFNNVQSFNSGRVKPVDLIYIGSFPTPGFTPSFVYCSACPDGTTRLYGTLAE